MNFDYFEMECEKILHEDMNMLADYILGLESKTKKKSNVFNRLFKIILKILDTSKSPESKKNCVKLITVLIERADELDRNLRLQLVEMGLLESLFS